MAVYPTPSWISAKWTIIKVENTPDGEVIITAERARTPGASLEAKTGTIRTLTLKDKKATVKVVTASSDRGGVIVLNTPTVQFTHSKDGASSFAEIPRSELPLPAEIKKRVNYWAWAAALVVVWLAFRDA